MGMTDSDVHWVQLLGNLGVHEADYAFDRGGVRCVGDFTPWQITYRWSTSPSRPAAPHSGCRSARSE